MPDNGNGMPAGKWGLPDWLTDPFERGMSSRVERWARGGQGSGILPTDPDGTVDWETVMGLEDTDRPASSGIQSVGGCAITVPVRVTQRAVCPTGYVVVQPAGEGKQCMLKPVAIKLGYYKQPAKPPIKASDWRCLKRSGAVIRRMDSIARQANAITGKGNLSRRKR